MKSLGCLAVGVLLAAFPGVLLGDDEPDARDLRKALRTSGEPSARKEAVQALAKILRTAKSDDQKRQALDGLSDALRDPDPSVRVRAAEAALEVGAAAKELIPALVNALGDARPEVRVAADAALAVLRLYSKPTIPQLVKMLEDKDQTVRNKAASALALFGAEGKAAVPVLVQVLRQSEGQEAVNAAYSLSSIGPAAMDAAPALLDALGSGATALQGSAAYALKHIKPRDESSVKALIAILCDARAPVWLKGSVAEVLGAIGADARQATPFLIDLLMTKGGSEDSTDRVAVATFWARRYAAQALARMGQAAHKEAVPALTKVVQDRDAPYPVRAEAARALAAFGPSAEVAIPVLATALRTCTDGSVRDEARAALAAVGPKAIPVAKEMLKSPNGPARFHAVWMLEKMGEEGKAVLDADPTLRRERPR